MRNNLNRTPQVLATALFPDHGGIDLSGCDIVCLVGRFIGKALVVPQVEIGLRAIIGDEDFAVLVW